MTLGFYKYSNPFDIMNMAFAKSYQGGFSMKNKNLYRIVAGALLLLIFILFTVSLAYVDVKPVGPNNSNVGYSTINSKLHEFLGVNMTLYIITDWAGLVPFFTALFFAALGLIQWINRKNVLKVDRSILLLGVYYLLVFSVYLFFEFVVINRRPILIEGFHEASYPSSTTMLAMCVMPTTVIQAKRLIKSHAKRRIVVIFCIIFEAFMVIGRLLSGVHWFTDILGGAIFSTGIVMIYSGVAE